MYGRPYLGRKQINWSRPTMMTRPTTSLRKSRWLTCTSLCRRRTARWTARPSQAASWRPFWPTVDSQPKSQCTGIKEPHWWLSLMKWLLLVTRLWMVDKTALFLALWGKVPFSPNWYWISNKAECSTGGQGESSAVWLREWCDSRGLTTDHMSRNNTTEHYSVEF